VIDDMKNKGARIDDKDVDILVEYLVKLSPRISGFCRRGHRPLPQTADVFMEGSMKGRVIAAFMVAFATSAGAFAQTMNATLGGTVSDASRALIPA
jgi:hypothetical protein